MFPLEFPDQKEILNFVRQSNAIEGIRVPESHDFFRGHVAAAYAVIESLGQGVVPFPREIHGILMRAQPDKCPGEYRSVAVRIGNIGTPTPDVVPQLMRDLFRHVAVGISQGGMRDEAWIWDVHNEFEAIHPFQDGNGRVGRIWMNAFRLWFGFKWLTIWSEERHEYYNRINEFRLKDPRYEHYLPMIDGQLGVETICE